VGTNFFQHSISTKTAIARAPVLGKYHGDHSAESNSRCFGDAMDRCVRQSESGCRALYPLVLLWSMAPEDCTKEA